MLALRPALTAVLFREGVLSLGAAAKLSGLPLVDFIQHLSSLASKLSKPMKRLLDSAAQAVETAGLALVK